MTTNKQGRPQRYFTISDKKKADSKKALKCYYAKKNKTMEQIEAERNIKRQHKQEEQQLKEEKRQQLRERQLQQTERKIKRDTLKRLKNMMLTINEMKIEQLKELNHKIAELTSSSSSSEYEISSSD